MHILFLGSKPTDRHLEVLINESVNNGHKVTVISNPISCIFTPFMSIDTIHVHSWKSTIILRLVMPFIKSTTTIWTISNLPEFSNANIQSLFQRFILFIASKFTTICTPSRMVQYRLLALYSVKSEYIPDGYTVPILPDIRPAVFGLRKEQYGIVFAENADQLKQISKTTKSLLLKKKLVLFSDRTYSGFKSINLPLTSRGAQSLVRQAAFIICADPAYSSLALLAMDAGRNVIATTDPLHEELFGTTAQYYQKNDSTQLRYLLQGTLKNRTLNTAAQVRAKNHFQWDKITQEYMRVYRHSPIVLVPFDSIIPRNSFQTAE
ncbi:MAG TPA: hypothetical protein VJI96_01460 [Candidatus Andersenbacteria bacterium]|nr:hypothetical protein [Candidatus Andersenbacteria bacterium]